MRVRLCFPIVVIVFTAAVGFTPENPAKNGVFHGRVPGPGQVLVRTSIFRLMDSNPSAIDSLRRGVSAMQKRQCPDPMNLATCDPTSWTYQANIHGTYTINPGATLWNTCQHGSFFFFSWHRMYLYYFERILRAASGDSNFALPYWNYTDDPARTDPDQRQLPQPFRLPADTAINPLYVANRATPINDGTGYLLLADVDYSQAFQYTLFEAPAGSGFTSFGGGIVSQPTQFNGDFGQLEWRPHNFVHTDIGGWMGDANTAALDPIFYLHHANIDRLWKRWLAQRGGRQNPSDQAWKTTIFTFYDETGKQVPLSGQDIVDTVGQLGYCYDDDPGCNVPNPPGNLGVIVN